MLSKEPETLVYMLLYLLCAHGIDLRGAALIDRERVLQQFQDAPSTIQHSDHFAMPGPKFFNNVCKLGLSKRT